MKLKQCSPPPAVAHLFLVRCNSRVSWTKLSASFCYTSSRSRLLDSSSASLRILPRSRARRFRLVKRFGHCASEFSSFGYRPFLWHIARHAAQTERTFGRLL